jgi:dTDP-glucose 4,6-dehydratase
MKIICTGGRGFIGSHFVEEALRLGHTVLDIDKITYAANKDLPWDHSTYSGPTKYKLLNMDIAELTYLPPCDVLINFAAESHVANSITSSKLFLQSNVVGTHNLLELLRGKPYERPLYVHISTDEVYGDDPSQEHTERSILDPGNPYAASKAAAEMFVLAYHKTYGLDYVITRSANNYGTRQFEEKFVPICMQHAASRKPIPLHGDGSYIRDWLFVKDNVSAIFAILNKGVKNTTINIGANNYLTNKEVANIVLSWYGAEDVGVVYVENRLGQDICYQMDTSIIRSLGWTPQYPIGLKKLV